MEGNNRGIALAAALTVVVLIGVSGLLWARLSGSDAPSVRGIEAPAQTLTDLPYAGASPAQKLDLYLPERTGEAIGLVILIHGGGWQSGDKREDTGSVTPLLERGLAVAALNYRLSPEARYPAAVQDVKAAVRWLRGQAPTYGLHPGRFAAWGYSAGGHLAAMVGATGAQPSPFDAPELGNPDVSAEVQAVVVWYGPTNFLTMDTQARTDGCPGQPYIHDLPTSAESLWMGAPIQSVAEQSQQASPVTWIRPETSVPPFYLVYGEADCIVPPAQGRELLDRVAATGAEVTMEVVAGAQHADPLVAAEQAASTIAFVADTIG